MTAPAPSGTTGATVLLLRHARSTANTAGVLAGRTPGVHLDDHGRGQADGVADRLADVPVSRIVSSPLDRCRETVGPLAERLGLTVDVDDRLAEVDYGHWSGRPLKDLVSEPLWRVVQGHPSAAAFPGGESLSAMSARAVAAVRDAVATAALPLPAPPDPAADPPAPRPTPPATPVVLVCSHGDVLKAILADALGLHLDQFQRIVAAPASLSVIRYTDLRPFVERVNDTGDLTSLRPAPPAADAAGSNSDAVPGGTTR